MGGAAVLRSLARAAYHLPGPGFWRSVDGLRRDVASLPVRLRDPERRGDPWEVIHHVGSDYRATGQGVFEVLRDYGGFTPSTRVLDIGCGNGRVTLPLSKVLGEGGRYIGFDVSRSAVAYCRRRYGGRTNFSFHHLDIHNGAYNPNGAIPEVQAVFPCPDGSVDLAFATSVFTHLPRGAVRRYFEEIARVMAHKGRALVTMFLIDDAVKRAAAEGRTAVPLRPAEPGVMVIDPQWPETGIAYDQGLVRAELAAAGLRLDHIHFGHWRPGATYPGGQDLLILSRRETT